MSGLVSAEAASSQGTEQMPQQSKSQEVDGFVGQLELRGTRWRILHTLRVLVERGRRLLIGSHPPFFDHLPNQLIDELVEFFGFTFSSVFKPLIEQAPGNATHLNQFLDNRLLQGIKRVWISYIAKAVLKAALKQELGQLVHQFLEAEAVEWRADAFCVSGDCHLVQRFLVSISLYRVVAIQVLSCFSLGRCVAAFLGPADLLDRIKTFQNHLSGRNPDCRRCALAGTEALQSLQQTLDLIESRQNSRSG